MGKTKASQKSNPPEDDLALCLRVGGNDIVIPQALFHIGEDLAAEAKVIPDKLIWLGELLGTAEEQKIMVDAEYRSFRAAETERILAADPKLAEWKVKARIESTERFGKFKTGIAVAEKNLAALRGAVQALDAKLQVVGTLLGGEAP
jgi:hypothetical protein